jgi:rubrerythrin
MNCINSSLLKRIAALLDIEELDKLKDRRDKLVAKLFKKKLELLFDDESNALFRCAFCGELFTQNQRAWGVCTKAKIFIDAHG